LVAARVEMVAKSGSEGVKGGGRKSGSGRSCRSDETAGAATAGGGRGVDG
jgi:hypothetical protein